MSLIPNVVVIAREDTARLQCSDPSESGKKMQEFISGNS